MFIELNITVSEKTLENTSNQLLTFFLNKKAKGILEINKHQFEI